MVREFAYVFVLVLMLGTLALFSGVSTPTSAFVANLPPQWDFTTSEFSVDDELRLDLSTAFFDPDFDPLAFGVSAPDGVYAVVEGDTLVVRLSGEATVTLTASDGKAIVSKNIQVSSR